MFDDRGSDQVAADIEQVIERRDRQADIALEPGAELALMRGDRRGTLRRFALIEPRMRQHAPQGNRLRAKPVAREASAVSSALGRCPGLGARAPVHAAAPLGIAAAFRAGTQEHPAFSGLTQACMRDTLGSLQQIVGPSIGMLASLIWSRIVICQARK